MTPLTPEQRSLRARLAAQSRWSQRSQAERRAETQPARDGFSARFEDEPNPEAARAAYFTRLSLESSKKRGQRGRPSSR
jgi:hypothetical protein